jgi:hypothetical protein
LIEGFIQIGASVTTSLFHCIFDRLTLHNNISSYAFFKSRIIGGSIYLGPCKPIRLLAFIGTFAFILNSFLHYFLSIWHKLLLKRLSHSL